MQLPKFQTPGVFLKRYFQNNPEQLKSYVGAGLIVAKLVVSPLSAALKHLIEIQGMDPNIEPGRRMREQFNEALNSAFWKLHNHEYDSDFDFSWLSKKYEEARKSNGQFPFDLSKDDFKELTDVSSLRSPPATKTTTEAGVPVTIDQSPMDELASLLGVYPVNQIAPEPAEQARDFYFDHDISKLSLPRNTDALKEALAKLVQVAKDLEEDNTVDPKELFAKTDYLKGVARDLKQYSVPARQIKKAGKVHRAKTGDTKAVKQALRKSPKPVKKVLNKITNIDAAEKRVDHRARIAAAHELTNEMIIRGLCSDSPDDIHAQVQEILKFPEDAFRSLKSVVMRHPINDMKTLERLDDGAEKSEQAFKSNKGSFRRTPSRR